LLLAAAGAGAGAALDVLDGVLLAAGGVVLAAGGVVLEDASELLLAPSFLVEL
jgi:hypothetical protein